MANALDIAAQGAGQILGTGLGMATANWQDKRQLEQEQKLQRMEIAGQQQMARFNQQLALEMWDKTNYDAQRKQMEKAGLSVGLMYGQGGGGGTTTSFNPGSVGRGHAPVGGGEIGMGMQIGLQNSLTAAQIENIKADTNKKNVEAGKTGGIDTTIAQTTLENLKLDGANKIIQNQIATYEKEMADLNNRVMHMSEEEITEGVKAANNKLVSEARSAYIQQNIDSSTQDARIKQINTASEEQELRLRAQKLGLIKTGADIQAVNAGISKIYQEVKNLATERGQAWSKLEQKDREIEIQKALMRATQKQVEFNTSTPQEAKQWLELIGSVLGITGKPQATGNKIGF